MAESLFAYASRSYENHSENNLQYQSSVWMGVYDDQLYYYEHCKSSSSRTELDGWLSVFRENKIQKIALLGEGRIIHIIGSSNQYLYYWVYQYSPLYDILYCFDIMNHSEHQVFSGEASYANTYFFASDGSVYIPIIDKIERSNICFLHIQGETVLELTSKTEEYSCGPYKYMLLADSSNMFENLVQIDSKGMCQTIPLGNASHRAIISALDGIVIHNEGFSDLLYYIRTDGEVLELLQIPCLSSESAVTLCGTDIILSFKRFETYGQFGLLRYANDDLEGTYKISLTDFEIEKISDKIYSGFFAFNDEYLFATDDNCNIDILYHDGSTIPIKNKR